MATYRRALDTATAPSLPAGCDVYCATPHPPLALLLSAVHNALGELHQGRAAEQCSQRSLAGPDCAAAWHHFQAALSLWPDNTAALASLAGLHHDRGDLEGAVELFIQAATQPMTVGQPEPLGAFPWVQQWVLEPRWAALPFVTFMQALLLSLLGRHSQALLPLQRLSMQKRIAPCVWDQLHGPAPTPSQPPDPPIRLFRDAIPEDLNQRLMQAFSPTAPYWRETGYERRGYFGFWYDLRRPPANLVEHLIRLLLPLTGREAEIVGAEWWVHTRLIGRDVGHQLHYDTEEESIRRTAQVLHPVVSSVSYLAGEDAGPTLVLDQVVGGPSATHGWLVRPLPRAFMTFPGDRLHGVMPVCPTASTVGQPATQRVTLLIGFWGSDVASVAPRVPLGPCGPLPPLSRTCTWPQTLACEPAASFGPAKAALAMERVEFVSPVWDDIPPAPAGVLLLPVSPSVDLLFFAHTHRDFERWTLDVPDDDTDTNSNGDDASEEGEGEEPWVGPNDQ
eukprot:GGOE01001911.1.p1 GENE.GGOE01001911.1~~GGOE01001911.1.p1  ORF type:complete len:534 (+),score=115.03 GGOE01001911.1:86-1603(+)